jgi:hypothetical protein
MKMTIQSRQFFANLMQIIIPIGGLCAMLFLRAGSIENKLQAFVNITVQSPIPFFYQLPLMALS